MSRLLALDSNLALLLVVGRVDRRLIGGRHGRLGSFTANDYDILLGMVASAKSLLTTPNVLTEVSNLARYGMAEPYKTEIMRSLQSLVGAVVEQYLPSCEAAKTPEFTRLGLADAVWLSCLDPKTTLVTTDLGLYLALLDRGLDAVNFNHERDRYTIA